MFHVIMYVLHFLFRVVYDFLLQFKIFFLLKKNICYVCKKSYSFQRLSEMDSQLTRQINWIEFLFVNLCYVFMIYDGLCFSIFSFMFVYGFSPAICCHFFWLKKNVSANRVIALDCSVGYSSRQINRYEYIFL